MLLRHSLVLPGVVLRMSSPRFGRRLSYFHTRAPLPTVLAATFHAQKEANFIIRMIKTAKKEGISDDFHVKFKWEVQQKDLRHWSHRQS
jgi:hypothetical protein